MTLLLTNGIIALIFGFYPPAECEAHAERINNDYHYSYVLAFCEETNGT